MLIGSRLDDYLSEDEKKDLYEYIEIEIFKRKATEEEKELVKKFNEKGEEFKKIVFEFHTENTNRIDKILLTNVSYFYNIFIF